MPAFYKRAHLLPTAQLNSKSLRHSSEAGGQVCGRVAKAGKERPHLLEERELILKVSKIGRNYLIGERLISLLPNQVLLSRAGVRPIVALGGQWEEVLREECQLCVLDVLPQDRQQPRRSELSVLVLRGCDVQGHSLQDEPGTNGSDGSADDPVHSALEIEPMTAPESGKGDEEGSKCGRLGGTHHLEGKC